jgi:hypothetical protein
MFNLRSSDRLFGSFCVLLAACLAMQVSCLAQRGSTEQDAFFNPAEWSGKIFFALGMIESGNDDRGVGSAGEVSRYQIHPAVWKGYSNSRDYQNPDVSLQVARQHWNYLTNYFHEKTGRDPSPFDMYVLWNTRFGYYARNGFDPARINLVVRDRAQRFVNLVNR